MPTADRVPGLMNVVLGGYHVGDVEVVAAFDIAEGKVGLDLARRSWPSPTTRAFLPRARDGRGGAARPHAGRAGPLRARRGARERGRAGRRGGHPARAGAEVLVSYLPVGSEQATRHYAEQAIAAGCGFVNCIPVFIASDPAWRARFEAARLPILGDDIKSQVGATIVHRVLANLFRDRGVRVDRTYQLNFGGNTDFMNMLERDRLESKKLSKTRAVTSQLAETLSDSDAHVGPSDYVPWLEDRKWCHIRIEGTTFGDTPLNCELKLEVWDSPNSAGVVIDAVRCVKLALDRGIGGALTGPSSYFMKSPPEQFTDTEAKHHTEAFVAGTEQR